MVNGAAFVNGEKQGNNRSMYIEYEDELPHDLIYVILSRLPTKSIVRFKCLSKTWNSSIKSSYFLRLRQSIRNSIEILILFVSPESNLFATGLLTPHVFLGKVNVNHEDKSYFELNNSSCVVAMKKQESAYLDIQFVNGVFCFHRTFQFQNKFLNKDIWLRFLSERQANVLTHIFNPTTRQRVTLPYDQDLVFNNEALSSFTHFGYDHLRDKFKVLRVLVNQYGVLRKIKILTIGDHCEWRDITQDVYCPKICYSKDIGTCFNGAIHWLDLTNKVIVVFDLERERFKEIPIFNGFCPKYYRRIGQYDEHLCLVKRDDEKRPIEVSLLKDYENRVWIHERINEMDISKICHLHRRCSKEINLLLEEFDSKGLYYNQDSGYRRKSFSLVRDSTEFGSEMTEFGSEMIGRKIRLFRYQENFMPL